METHLNPSPSPHVKTNCKHNYTYYVSDVFKKYNKQRIWSVSTNKTSFRKVMWYKKFFFLKPVFDYKAIRNLFHDMADLYLWYDDKIQLKFLNHAYLIQINSNVIKLFYA